MALNLSNLKAAAEATGFDATKTVAGGSYTPPEKGQARARLIAYVEIGKHKHSYNGQDKVEDDVILVFELSGKKWPVKTADDGTQIPHRIEIACSKSLNVKSKFIKLFNAMNYEGTAKSFVDFLDKEFLVEVLHDEFDLKKEPGKKGIKATLYNKELGIYTVKKPFMALDPEDPDNLTHVPAGPRVSEIRAFLWNNPDMDQWASLYIPGTYEGGKTKNVFQEAIQKALNFQGSPIHELLQSGGESDKVAEQFNPGTDSDNPLDLP